MLVLALTISLCRLTAFVAHTWHLISLSSSITIFHWYTLLDLPFFFLLCLGVWSPEAYGSHRVFVCVCFRRKLSRARSPHPLKIKHWNLQCKLNTILSWNETGGFGIDDFIVELWRDLRSVAHLDGRFSLSGVRRRATCLQRTSFQLGSSICTTRQTKLNRDNPPGRRRYTGYPPQLAVWSSIMHMPRWEG